MNYQIEICANSVQSAINAEKGGASRVELCDNLWEGGTTPSHATILLAKRKLTIPVYVLVRPRGGDFIYSDLEFEIMKQDIVSAKAAGVDGIVSGVLLSNGGIDIERTRELVTLTAPLPFTFHRAFDHVENVASGIEDLVQIGVTRVLTSGQRECAIDGRENLKKMLHQAAGRIVILPGGGINKHNIDQLFEIGCREFHFSAKSLVKGQALKTDKIPMNGSLDIPEDAILMTDSKIVKEIKARLDEKI
ncbi:MAG: copper homeostasis protein CutC [Ekhidna sp.]